MPDGVAAGVPDGVACGVVVGVVVGVIEAVAMTNQINSSRLRHPPHAVSNVNDAFSNFVST